MKISRCIGTRGISLSHSLLNRDVEVYHLEKGWSAPPGTIRIKESGPLRCVLESTVEISPTSRLVQDIILTCTSSILEFETKVDWNENRKILKVVWPVDVNNDVANYDSQFGYVSRPTTRNNSWEMAKVHAFF
jgi:alpha-mannosidase